MCKAFSHRNHFSDLLRIHTTVKTYKCNECSKAYHLFDPQKSHTGGKPHKRVVCGKALILCSDLSNHQLINSELRFYPHRECGRCFGRHSFLTKQEKIHAGEKPYI